MRGSTFGKFHTFLRLSRLERRLAIKAIAFAALVRAGLWLLPFRVMQRVCERLGKSAWNRSSEASPQEIAWAVRLASRYVPAATCLTQALTAQILMGREGHAGDVHIGVYLDAKLGFRAHAWVESEGKVLVGGSEDLGQYAPILVLDGKGTRESQRF